MAARGPGGYVFAGPIVIVPARVAALLVDLAELDQLRILACGTDPEAAGVLTSLLAAGRVHQATTTLTEHAERSADIPQAYRAGEALANPPAGAPKCAPVLVTAPPGWLNTATVAARLAVTERAIRARAGRRTIAAVKTPGGWRYHPDTIEAEANRPGAA